MPVGNSDLVLTEIKCVLRASQLNFRDEGQRLPYFTIQIQPEFLKLSPSPNIVQILKKQKVQVQMKSKKAIKYGFLTREMLQFFLH